MSSPEAPFDPRVRQLLDEVASASPTPGGGAVAALAAAMAAALVSMVGRLSSSSWAGAGGAVAQAELLRGQLEQLARENAQAYDDALRGLREARQSAGAIDARDVSLAAALARAAELPLRISEAAADVAALAELAANEGDQSARADAAAAALLAHAGAAAAANLIAVNLTAGPDDPRVLRAAHLAENARESALRALGP